MAKGQMSKQIITNKILAVFAGSFTYNDGKEIRIPMSENGESVEIKVTLTCAKTNIGSGEGALDFSAEAAAATGTSGKVTPLASQPTEEEKQNVADLCAKLGL